MCSISCTHLLNVCSKVIKWVQAEKATYLGAHQRVQAGRADNLRIARPEHGAQV